MLPPPRTAPVKAILATLMFELVGLRCRPLMRAENSSLVTRLRGQLSGSGWRGHPAGASSGDRRRRLHPKEPQAAPLRSRWTGGSPASIQVLVPPPGGWSSARLDEGGTPPVTWRASADASGFCWSRHVLRNRAFPSPPSGKAPGKPNIYAGQSDRDRSVSEPLSFRYVRYLTLSRRRTAVARRSCRPIATLWSRRERRFRRTNMSIDSAPLPDEYPARQAF